MKDWPWAEFYKTGLSFWRKIQGKGNKGGHKRRLWREKGYYDSTDSNQIY